MPSDIIVAIFETREINVFKAIHSQTHVATNLVVANAKTTGVKLGVPTLKVEGFYDKFNLTFATNNIYKVRPDIVHLFEKPFEDKLVVPVFPFIVAVKRALTVFKRDPSLIRSEVDQTYIGSLLHIEMLIQDVLRTTYGCEVVEKQEWRDDAMLYYTDEFEFSKVE